MNLDICGIDIIAEDITQPITKETGAVVEVNAGPGFRMHLSPTQGTPRNVGEAVVKMLYPMVLLHAFLLLLLQAQMEKQLLPVLLLILQNMLAKMLVILLQMEYIYRTSQYILVIAADL